MVGNLVEESKSKETENRKEADTTDKKKTKTKDARCDESSLNQQSVVICGRSLRHCMHTEGLTDSESSSYRQKRATIAKLA